MKNSTNPTQKTLTQVGIELDKVADQVALFPAIKVEDWLITKNLLRSLTRFNYPLDQLMELEKAVAAAFIMADKPNKSQVSDLTTWYRARNVLVGYTNKVTAHKDYDSACVGYRLIEALRRIQNKVSLIK